MFFGDGTRLDGIPKASTLRVGTTDIFSYYCEHTYSGTGSYVVSFVGENRNANVINMSTSDQQSFYVSTTITVTPLYGRNRSPVLRAPAIDQGAVGQVFLHNPAGYDADGDSLAYHLIDCQQVPNVTSTTTRPIPVICTNYVKPDNQAIVPGAKQVPFSGIPAGIPANNAIIVQDVSTGQITWNAPARAGIYNIAFRVDEIRRTANGFRTIGSVIRDMQIIIQATSNLPPTLIVPPDLCVIAGQNVTLNVSARDGVGTNATPTNVTLTAFSGILPPATFRQTSTGTSVTGTFSWNTDCSNVANQPYIVVFRAQDTPPNAATAPLVDIKPVRITVVGPPPQNLRVVQTAAGGITNVVSWNSYTCQNASQILIYRKENPSGFNPGPCETGIPPSAG
ncbi:MAG: hypothetical protein EOO60_11535, partial [Hymenobacter sp.]